MNATHSPLLQTDNWHRYQAAAVAVVFILPTFCCLLTSILITTIIYDAGWPAIETALIQSGDFISDLRNTALLLAASFTTVLFGTVAAWTVHTKKVPHKAVLVCLFLLPSALPYEAVTWIARTLPDDPVIIAFYVMVYRYLPISFIFSYLVLTRYSSHVLTVARSLGVSEARLILQSVLRTTRVPLGAQLLFVTIVMATDHVGMSYASGGRLTSLGNVIDTWSRTIDDQNRAVAYALTLGTALMGAIAAGAANVLGWWNQSIRGSTCETPQTRSAFLVGGLWLFALAVSGAPLIIALHNVDGLVGGLAGFAAAMAAVAPATATFLVLGASLSAWSAFVVYLVVQDRETKMPGAWVSVCVAASMFGLLVPPVMRGEFYLLPTTMLMHSAGNAAWAAFWVWITVFPAISAVAALHPASRQNRFQSVLQNAGVSSRKRLWRSLWHAGPVMGAATLFWLFFGIFDTSVTRSMAGVERPFGLWFRDRVCTTYDPGVISAGIIIAYALAVGIGAVAFILSKPRHSDAR